MRLKPSSARRFNVFVEWRDPLALEPDLTVAAAIYQVMAEESSEAAITALARVATGRHPALPTYAEISHITFLAPAEMEELRHVEASWPR